MARLAIAKLDGPVWPFRGHAFHRHHLVHLALPHPAGGAADAFWFALAISGFSVLYSAMWVRSGQSAILPAVAHGSVHAAVVFLTAVLPDADHGVAWNILCGMVAACGLGVLLWTRTPWAQMSKV